MVEAVWALLCLGIATSSAAMQPQPLRALSPPSPRACCAGRTHPLAARMHAQTMEKFDFVSPARPRRRAPRKWVVAAHVLQVRRSWAGGVRPSSARGNVPAHGMLCL